MPRVGDILKACCLISPFPDPCPFWGIPCCSTKSFGFGVRPFSRSCVVFMPYPSYLILTIPAGSMNQRLQAG